MISCQENHHPCDGGNSYGVHDVTIFPTKDIALKTLKYLRRFKAEEEKANFILVKVTRKVK